MLLVVDAVGVVGRCIAGPGPCGSCVCDLVLSVCVMSLSCCALLVCVSLLYHCVSGPVSVVVVYVSHFVVHSIGCYPVDVCHVMVTGCRLWYSGWSYVGADNMLVVIICVMWL